jgi:hypothetical protein
VLDAGAIRDSRRHTQHHVSTDAVGAAVMDSLPSFPILSQ